MLLRWRSLRWRRMLMGLRWRQAVRHAVCWWVAMMSRLHVVRRRLRVRLVRRCGRWVRTRVRGCGRGTLLMRRVVGVGAVHGRWRGMT